VVGHGLVPPGQVSADLCDREATATLLNEVRPDAVVHMVAYTSVDGCEEDPDRAFRLNVLTVQNVAAWIDRNPTTRLVQISTDQVYDGPGVHDEEDVTIRNMYAITKYAAELAALRVSGIALRTNFFGRSRTPGRTSFSDWLIEGFRSGRPMTLLADVMWSPLAMPTLAEMILLVLQRGGEGVFNLGSRQGMSKRDFAHALARELGLSVEASRDGTQQDLGLKAVRPTGMLMNCSRFERTYGVTLPTLAEEVRKAEA
jgi:dTDP-4-dehydrorhamnose reductase